MANIINLRVRAAIFVDFSSSGEPRISDAKITSGASHFMSCINLCSIRQSPDLTRLKNPLKFLLSIAMGAPCLWTLSVGRFQVDHPSSVLVTMTSVDRSSWRAWVHSLSVKGARLWPQVA